MQVASKMGRIGRGLLAAVVSLILVVVITFVVAAIAPTGSDGDIEVDSFFGIVLIICILLWFVAPIVVFILDFRRRRPQSILNDNRDQPAASSRPTYESLFTESTPIGELWDAAVQIAL
jgi:heme/copper-type cytochrome/quinol oxidase subunit 2